MIAGRKRAAVVLGLLGAAAIAWACNNAAFTDESCSKGTDCLAPFVCCTNPSTPKVDQSIPFCEKIDSCRGYLPFLVEGNPCNRLPPQKDREVTTDTICSEGLECCTNTLTCARAGTCPTTPPPVSDSGAADGGEESDCSADADCSGSDVCCLISFFNRNGKCRGVQACRQLTAPPVPGR